MSDIFWEPHISSRIASKRTKTPQITLSKGSGRISLNAAACELIPNIYSYPYAELYKGIIDGKFKRIGIKFTKEKTVKSLPISRKRYKNTYASGAVIHSKSLVREIYDANAALPLTCHFVLELQNSTEKNMLTFSLIDSLID